MGIKYTNIFHSQIVIFVERSPTILCTSHPRKEQKWFIAMALQKLDLSLCCATFDSIKFCPIFKPFSTAEQMPALAI
jgi:hypothetical protein